MVRAALVRAEAKKGSSTMTSSGDLVCAMENSSILYPTFAELCKSRSNQSKGPEETSKMAARDCNCFNVARTCTACANQKCGDYARKSFTPENSKIPVPGSVLGYRTHGCEEIERQFS